MVADDEAVNLRAVIVFSAAKMPLGDLMLFKSAEGGPLRHYRSDNPTGPCEGHVGG